MVVCAGVAVYSDGLLCAGRCSVQSYKLGRGERGGGESGEGDKGCCARRWWGVGEQVCMKVLRRCGSLITPCMRIALVAQEQAAHLRKETGNAFHIVP